MPETVDLRCGRDPTDPSTLYRLTQVVSDHSGQATVYRGIALGTGRTAPVIIRVWKPSDDDSRSFKQECESWHKADQVLHALTWAGVPHICRPRERSFESFPPWRPDESPNGKRIPVQILEYVEGVDLTERLSEAYQRQHPDSGPVDGVRVLTCLAETLAAFIGPYGPDGAIQTYVHQDVKPRNLIIGPDGRVTLIDFTGAREFSERSTRYYTQNQHSPAIAGTPAGDVSGFGAVAYHLLFRNAPLRHNALALAPELDRYPRLRAHLLQVLAVDSVIRTAATALADWTLELARLVDEERFPSPLVSWQFAVERPTQPLPAPRPDHPTDDLDRSPHGGPGGGPDDRPGRGPDGGLDGGLDGEDDTTVVADDFLPIARLRRQLAALPTVPPLALPSLPVLTLVTARGRAGVAATPVATPSGSTRDPWAGSARVDPRGSAGRTSTTRRPPRRWQAPRLSRSALWRQVRRGSEVTLIPGGLMLISWSVWLLSGASQPPAAVVQLATVAATLLTITLVLQLGALLTAATEPPPPRGAWFHRVLHAPIGLLSIAISMWYVTHL